MSGDENHIDIRRADAADVDALFDIRIAAIENRMSREELAAIGVTPEAIADLLKGGQAAAFLAIRSGRSLGFSVARADVADVFALFVRPEGQHIGLGSRLLAEAERWLAKTGVDWAWLLTGAESAAAAFYQRRGWTRQGGAADGEIRLAKRLRTPTND